MNPETLQQLELDNLSALPQFQELVELTAHLCLREPEQFINSNRYSTSLETSSDHPNPWPIRAAIERAEDITKMPYKGAGDEGFDSSRELDINAVLASPEILGPRPIPEVQKIVKSLGESLLDDMFVCLGGDAPEMVEKWKTAPGLSEKSEIIDWLSERVFHITTKHREKDIPEGHEAEDWLVEPREGYYHPSRLSPKLLGIYPDTTFTPTCLSVSMLIASFFRQAGVPTLHAGVMRTALLENRFNLMAAGFSLEKFAEEVGITLPPRTAQNLKDNANAYGRHHCRDLGFHGGIFAQIENDSWTYMDPYMQVYAYYQGDSAKQITIAHDQIQEVPGLEKTLYEGEGLNSWWMVEVSYKMEQHLTELTDITRDFFTRAFRSEDPLSVFRDYTRSVLEYDPFGDIEDGEGEASAEAVLGNLRFKQLFYDGEDWERLSDEEITREKEKYFQDISKAIVSQYLFPDCPVDDISKGIERCKRDQRYLERRIEDFTVLPFMMLLRGLSMMANDILNQRVSYDHSCLELGSAPYRIGMCVLSHIAGQTEDNLPPSFWTTHWASGMAWADHSSYNAHSQAQRELAGNLAKLMNTTRLTYHHKDEKINAFLEQEHP